MTHRQILSPWAPVGAKKNNKLVSFNAKPKHPVTKQHLFHKLQTKFIKTKVHTFLHYLNCKVFVRNSSITNSLRLHIKLDIISFLNNAPCGDWVNQFWLPWSSEVFDISRGQQTFCFQKEPEVSRCCASVRLWNYFKKTFERTQESSR